MWALLPFQPLRPWPPNTISPPKPPPSRHLTTANNLQDSQDIGSLGQAVVTALKSNEPKQRYTAKSKPKTPPSPPPPPLPPPPQEQKQDSQVQQQKQQLSGADVLIALQRATAQKAKKKKEKKEITVISGGRNNSGKEDEGTPNFSDSKPLSIKTEWNDRLEDLERRLQELLHN